MRRFANEIVSLYTRGEEGFQEALCTVNGKARTAKESNYHNRPEDIRSALERAGLHLRVLNAVLLKPLKPVFGKVLQVKTS